MPNALAWTRDDYHRMAGAGLFNKRRVELIEGIVIEVDHPDHRHWFVHNLTAEALREVFVPDFIVSAKAALSFSASEPEPDIAVIRGDIRQFVDALPATADLVVEVADSTTLAFDRTVKASLYAKAGVPEYWVVNLVDNVLEVHRSSADDVSQPFGHGYGTSKPYRPGEAIMPLARLDRAVRVDACLR
jgi:Uma2 family endonuclease